MRATVDFSKTVGTVKPLHGVNNGPRGFNFSINNTKNFIDAAVPHCRLHDTEYPYGSGVFVDIHCVFPDFSRDPDDPESYRFYHTDDYIKSIIDAGADVVYRLGESIDHRPKKSFVFPPSDNEKWARICEGIIRHYNHGWADGFEFGIEYWEIWNEPDNSPVVESNPMWQGTAEQYFELYAVTARHLKNKFPEIKIGGYASCGFYAIFDKYRNAKEDIPGRFAYFTDFFESFMKYITADESKAPIDFFTWHSYSPDVSENVAFARYVRERLDSYGLKSCESSLNEWNIRPCRFDIPFENAATVCANFCALAYEPLDSAQYYDAQAFHLYCGLFDCRNSTVLPAFHAFMAFGELYRLGGLCPAESEGEPLYLCAATDGKTKKLLAVNNSNEGLCAEISIAGAGKTTRCRCVDAEHKLEEKSSAATQKNNSLLINLGAYEIVLLDLE